MFLSAIGEAFPGCPTEPPLITTWFNRGIAVGSRRHKRARLVSGPRQTSVISLGF